VMVVAATVVALLAIAYLNSTGHDRSAIASAAHARSQLPSPAPAPAATPPTPPELMPIELGPDEQLTLLIEEELPAKAKRGRRAWRPPRGLAVAADASVPARWHGSVGPAIARFPDLPPAILNKLVRDAEEEARARRAAELMKTHAPF